MWGAYGCDVTFGFGGWIREVEGALKDIFELRTVNFVTKVPTCAS